MKKGAGITRRPVFCSSPRNIFRFLLTSKPHVVYSKIVEREEINSDARGRRNVGLTILNVRYLTLGQSKPRLKQSQASGETTVGLFSLSNQKPKPEIVPLNCPHCHHPLTADEIKSLWCSYAGTLQTPHPGPGRPAKPRCPCGRMTKDYADKTGHHCQDRTR